MRGRALSICAARTLLVPVTLNCSVSDSIYLKDKV
jgi:hypothetical protein